MMETFLIWLGFAAGLYVRWAQRTWHIVTEVPERSLLGYLERNYVRLFIRGLSNAAIFYYVVLPQGWILVAPIAFSVGFSFETISEDAVNAAKHRGEHIVSKFKKE